MGTAWSEPTLIRLASGFEAVPKFLETLPLDFPGHRGGHGRDGVADKHHHRKDRACLI